MCRLRCDVLGILCIIGFYCIVGDRRGVGGSGDLGGLRDGRNVGCCGGIGKVFKEIEGLGKVFRKEFLMRYEGGVG